MDITIYNTSFSAVGILDNAESFIWVDKYDEEGTFELYTKYDPTIEALFLPDYYLKIKESDRTMIIEGVHIKDDVELGPKLIITGRSLESILDRRIILRQITIDTSLQSGILALLNAEVISGLYPERNFPNFIFSSSSDPLVTGLTLKAQYYSEYLLDVIKYLCHQGGIGFKVILNSSNQFVFSLYAGKDRSYSQSTNPYVIFSPEFDNLLRSEYLYTKRYLKTYALVSGDPTVAGSGLPIRAQSFTGVQTGLDRREMFVDASDMSKFLWNSSTEIPDLEYQNQLKQRGDEELAIRQELTIFDGEIDLINSYKYGVDFFLGDIIQMKDAYGHFGRRQIMEMTFSENISGRSIYPTLRTV